MRGDRKTRLWIVRPLNWYLQRRAKGIHADSDIDDWREILENEIETQGIDGYRTMNARHILATHFDEMNKYDEAVPLRRTQLTLLREQRGPDDTWTIAEEERLAFELAGLGNYDEATDLLVHARDIYIQAEGLDCDGAKMATGLIAWIEERIALESGDA